MHRTLQRRALGFESLVGLVKSIAADSGQAIHDADGSSRVMKRLQAVLDGTVALALDHPFHTPVIARQLANVTSRINVKGKHRCVTCGGTCDDIHVEIIRCVDRALPYLAPKGITQLMALYLPCRNPHMQGTLRNIELRGAFIMFCAIIANAENKAEIASEVANRLRRSYNGCMPSSNGDEAFAKFLNLGDLDGCHNAGECLEMPQYEVTIRDVCEAVCAVSEESHNSDLLLYLTHLRLQQIDIDTIKPNEVKTVCRILHALSKRGYRVEYNSKLASSICEKHARSMNAKDISCIFQAVQFRDEAALVPLLRRIEAILSKKTRQNAVDVKSVSVLITTIASIAHPGNVECLHTLKRCAEAIIGDVKRDAAIIGRPETFTAVVMALEKLQAFRCNQGINRCFGTMIGYMLHNRQLWVAIKRTYDLNQLLAILAAIRTRAKGDDHTRHKPTPNVFVGEVSELVLISGLETAIKRLSDLYVAGLAMINSRAEGVDNTLIRNLCHFLAIYREHDLCEIRRLDEEFNRELLHTLRRRHDCMTPVDVIELVLYLMTVDPQGANLATMQAAAIKRAETDSNVDERQWARIRRLVSHCKQK
ncbi:hypothetical protein, conserved [Babesia bigemina]|uniref:Uncharacterized protein n=1 Tax=Babesia bigemina TaxID=5866 RepID=A0A061DDU7_BABBI|nr:hypothetical protein, conserved [Babesia bigemina]CDR97704.1 hypothetical protein, conserved [Babesia bigemina]|eukprot:XP_012769890.1 hypothetical protein, conserved [Babesia bigemina]